jgi:2-methylcitrate dehydratase PrpD
MEELRIAAQFAASVKYRDLPEAVIERAKLILLDSVGLMLAGGQEERVKRMTFAIRKRGSIGRSTVFGDRLPADAADAAMINGVSAAAHVLDEGHKYARGHVATYVLPAIWAIAEEQEKSGAELLAAFVSGYEIAARMGIGCRVRESMHPSGTWGTVGAAASVAAMLGMPVDQIEACMNASAPLTLATSWDAAVKGATVRDLYSGYNGHTGIWAVRWVQAGFTGFDEAVEEVFGRVASEHFEASALADGLGSRWEILSNYFKVHACCRNFQAGIDAALRLHPLLHVDPEMVDSILVETYSDPARDNVNPDPQNELAAKESLPVSLALTLVHGRCDQSVFALDKVFDPQISRLAHKVKVVCDPEMEALLPEKRPVRLTVKLVGGQTLTEYEAIALGDPAKPITNADLVAKYRACADPVIGQGAALNLMHAIENLEGLKQVSQLVDPVRR